MGENVLTKMAKKVKALSSIASDLTDELGKQVTGIDKKKVIQYFKDKLGDSEPDEIDRSALLKEAKAEFKDSVPDKPAAAAKKSWNQRRKEKKKTKS
jgi:hypothetical protein